MNDVEIYHCTQYQLVVRCNLFQFEFRAINDCNLVIKFTTKQLQPVTSNKLFKIDTYNQIFAVRKMQPNKYLQSETCSLTLAT